MYTYNSEAPQNARNGLTDAIMNKTQDNKRRMMYNDRIGVHLYMPKTSEAHLKAIKKYQQKAVVQIKLALNRKTDADILEVLDSVDNKQGFVKKAIREYIKREAE